LALAPLAAGGSPIDDKRAQAARLQQEIDANGAKLDALSEQYHGVEYELARIDADVARTGTGIAQAQHRYDGVRAQVEQRAVQLYMSAGAGSPLAAVDVGSLGELGARSQYTAALTDRDDALLAQLRGSKEDLQSRRAQLARDRTRARTERDRLASTRTQLTSATKQEQALLAQTKTDLAKLVDQYRRQAAAAAARLAAAAKAAKAAEQARAAAASRAARGTGATTSSTSGHTGGGSNAGSNAGSNGGPGNGPAPSPSVSIPPASSAAMMAVNFALAQVGKPYVFDAAGPGAYDCSGLTMAAWAYAGVSMPHYSGAQYDMFPHVPVSEAQPGDLLFRGAGGSQHVEIYIGNGMVVTAPHTGDFVKVAPMGRVLPMAARP
jgi:cell wall-associated NlpC family hydrolase